VIFNAYSIADVSIDICRVFSPLNDVHEMLTWMQTHTGFQAMFRVLFVEVSCWLSTVV